MKRDRKIEPNNMTHVSGQLAFLESAIPRERINLYGEQVNKGKIR